MIDVMAPDEADGLLLAAMSEQIAEAVSFYDSEKLIKLAASLLSRPWSCVETRSVAGDMANAAFSAAADIRISMEWIKASLDAMLVARRIERIALGHRHRPKVRRAIRNIARDLRRTWGVSLGYMS